MLVTNELYQNSFLSVFHMDNVYPVTLKLKPIYWAFTELLEKDLQKYFTKRCIDVLLVAERGENDNLHYHGLIGFPYADIKRKFEMWFRKSYGTIHYSEKGDAKGWESYVYKNCPAPVYDDAELQKAPYLFDKSFEPK